MGSVPPNMPEMSVRELTDLVDLYGMQIGELKSALATLWQRFDALQKISPKHYERPEPWDQNMVA